MSHEEHQKHGRTFRWRYNRGAEWQLPAAASLKLAARLIHVQMEEAHLLHLHVY